MPRIVSWLRVLAGVALLLATRWASAAPTEGATGSASGSMPEEAIFAVPRAASHEGVVSGERIAWHTTLLDASFAASSGGRAGQLQTRPFAIKLARPLVLGAVLVSSTPPGAKVAYGEDGAIVAFVFDAAAVAAVDDARAWSAKIVIETTQPVDRESAVLAPPFVFGETPQVITVSGDEGSRFEPDSALHLVRHIGFLAPDDIDHEARRACADLTFARGLPLDAEPIYVRGTSLVVPHLHGRITTSGGRNRGGLIAAALAFLVCGAGLLLLYRRLTSSAEVERADAALRAEFESVERETDS